MIDTFEEGRPGDYKHANEWNETAGASKQEKVFSPPPLPTFSSMLDEWALLDRQYRFVWNHQPDGDHLLLSLSFLLLGEKVRNNLIDWHTCFFFFYFRK